MTGHRGQDSVGRGKTVVPVLAKADIAVDVSTSDKTPVVPGVVRPRVEDRPPRTGWLPWCARRPRLSGSENSGDLELRPGRHDGDPVICWGSAYADLRRRSIVGRRAREGGVVMPPTPHPINFGLVAVAMPRLAGLDRHLVGGRAHTALSVGRTQLFDLLRRGEIISVKIGRQRLIPAESLDAYLARLVRSKATQRAVCTTRRRVRAS